MKVLLAAVFIAALAQVHSFKKNQTQLLTEYFEECIEKTQVDKVIYQKARMGHFDYNGKLKTHLLCLAEKLRFQEPDGKLRKDVIRYELNLAFGDVDLTEDLIRACAISHIDPKRQAFRLFKCINRKTDINFLY